LVYKRIGWFSTAGNYIHDARTQDEYQYIGGSWRQILPETPGSAPYYGTCSTAAATAVKVVWTTNSESFVLQAGVEVTVNFTVTNTAASPTLNVNGTGAKPIYYRNAAITAGTLAANRVYMFVYDGTQWELVGDIDTNTTYSTLTQALVDTGTETTGKLISAKILKDSIDKKAVAYASASAALTASTASPTTLCLFPE
jgi:hypothetical protein